MSQTTPTPVDALPAAPSTSNPSTFSALADAFIAALALFRTQINAIATNVYNNAVDAYSNAVAAASDRAAADVSAAAAAASAASSAGGAASQGTSTTSLSVGTGSKSLTIQTGKAFVAGMFVVIARTSNAAHSWMAGQVTSYTSGTGALVVEVTQIGDTTGTFTDWAVSLTAPPQQIGNSLTKTANYTAVAFDDILCDTSSGAFAVTLPASPVAWDVVWLTDKAGTFAIYPLTINANGNKIMGSPYDRTVNTNGASFALVYTDATNGWRIKRS